MAAYLTARDVAARWACSPSYVRRLARSGQLAGMRLGSDWRFGAAAITAYEDRHTTQPAEPTKPAERRATAALPADYEPVFTDLWPHLGPPRKSGPQH